MMKSELLLMLCGCVLLVDAPASSEEPPVDCAIAMAQPDLNICAHREYEVADAELNAVYKKAMDAARAMDEELKDLGEHYVGAVGALKRAQRSWIGYRDSHCELAGFTARGGQMEPMLVSGCLAELTRKRTVELKTMYEQEN